MGNKNYFKGSYEVALKDKFIEQYNGSYDFETKIKKRFIYFSSSHTLLVTN